VYSFGAHNNYSDILSLNINMPATCRVLSMGTPVPASALTCYYPVGRCSNWRSAGTWSGTRVACYLVTAAVVMYSSLN